MHDGEPLLGELYGLLAPPSPRALERLCAIWPTLVAQGPARDYTVAELRRRPELDFA